MNGTQIQELALKTVAWRGSAMHLHGQHVQEI
jgi:hypothetical protein